MLPMIRFIIAKNITSNTTITEAVLIEAENAHLRSSYNIAKTWLLFSPDGSVETTFCLDIHQSFVTA